LSAVIVSGRSIFQVLVPAVADAPIPLEELLPDKPDEVLLRSLLVPLEELLPMPDVLERSAELLVPVPELLDRFALELLPAVFAPEPDVLERSALDELLPMPPLELELASLRGGELLLEPIPLLEPLPVLEPLAPDAPEEPDSRTSETVTSGAPWLAAKVTIATPNPFCTPLVDEPLRPPELDEKPLRPEPDEDDEPLRPEPDEDEVPLEPIPLEELLLRSALDDEPVALELAEPRPLNVFPPLCSASPCASPALVLRSALDEDEEPMPPLDDDEPERPPLEVPLVSERRLLLPLLPPLLLPELPLELPEEFTGQLLIRAGFETSPCTIVRSLN